MRIMTPTLLSNSLSQCDLPILWEGAGTFVSVPCPGSVLVPDPLSVMVKLKSLDSIMSNNKLALGGYSGTHAPAPSAEERRKHLAVDLNRGIVPDYISPSEGYPEAEAAPLTKEIVKSMWESEIPEVDRPRTHGKVAKIRAARKKKRKQVKASRKGKKK